MTNEAVPAAASAAQPAPAKSSADKAHGRVNAAAVILLVFGGISALNTLAVMFWVVVAAAARAGRQGVVTFQTDGGFMNGGRPFTDGQGGGMPTVIGGQPADAHMLGFAFLALLIIGAAGCGHRRQPDPVRRLDPPAAGLGSPPGHGRQRHGPGRPGRGPGVGAGLDRRLGAGHGRCARVTWASTCARRFGAIVGFGAIMTLALMLAYGWILFILARHEEAFEPMGGPQPTV